MIDLSPFIRFLILKRNIKALKLTIHLKKTVVHLNPKKKNYFLKEIQTFFSEKKNEIYLLVGIFCFFY